MTNITPEQQAANDYRTDERVKEFFAFVEKNGRLPKRAVADERGLYDWCRKIRLNEHQIDGRFLGVIKCINDNIKDIDKTVNEKISRFWDFVDSNNRLPSKSNQDELPLYRMCSSISSNSTGMRNRFPDVWKKMLELGWIGAKKRSKDREKAFCKYINKHGCLPKYGEKDYNRFQKLYYSLLKDKKNARKNYPKAWKLIKEMNIDTYRPRKNMSKEFWNFVNAHGSLPVRGGENESLYIWYRKMVRNANNIREKHPQEWQRMLELGAAVNKVKSLYETKSQLFWDFVERKGRLPRLSVKEERSLYWWCARVMTKNEDANVISKMKELGWASNSLNNSMQKLVEFVKLNKRLPSYDRPSEKTMYNKYLLLKYNKNGARDRFIDVWAKISKYGILSTYTDRLQNKLISFVLKNKRLPKWNDSDCKNIYSLVRKIKNDKNAKTKYRRAYVVLSDYGFLT